MAGAAERPDGDSGRDRDEGPGTPNARPNAYVARLSDRFLARLLDGLLFVVPFAILILAVGRPTVIEDTAGEPTGLDIKHWALLWGLFLVGTAVYEIVLTATTGQTLGKRWRHIRVVHLADGSVPGFSTSFARWITMNASSLLSLVVSTPLSGVYGLVDLGLGLRRPLHQCLHDLTAKTVVISDR